jgi:hypothetical protein
VGPSACSRRRDTARLRIASVESSNSPEARQKLDRSVEFADKRPACAGWASPKLSLALTPGSCHLKRQT